MIFAISQVSQTASVYFYLFFDIIVKKFEEEQAGMIKKTIMAAGWRTGT